MLRLSAPFGEALLEIKTASGRAAASAPSRQNPDLPGGMRVDDCQLATASLACKAGEVLSISLRLDLRDGWRSDFASGENLDAFSLGSGAGVAAVGMRDPEWLCRRFALTVIDVSKGNAARNLLTARCQVLSDRQIDIQAAVAWINQPATDQEKDSPWFAIDKAMSF